MFHSPQTTYFHNITNSFILEIQPSVMDDLFDICNSEEISWPIKTYPDSLSRLITGYRERSEVQMSLSGNYEFRANWDDWNAGVEVLPHDIQKIKKSEIIALIFTLIETKVISGDEKRFAFRVVYFPHSGIDCLWEENMAGSCKVPQLNPENWPNKPSLPRGVIWWNKY